VELSEWRKWWKQRGRLELNDLFMREWDPIGVAGIPGAADEYSRYVGETASKLRQGVTVDELTAYLSRVRTAYIGVAANPRTDRRVAELTIQWFTDAMGGRDRPQA
jgi:hypothetical protein